MMSVHLKELPARAGVLRLGCAANLHPRQARQGGEGDQEQRGFGVAAGIAVGWG